jgi:hypothetical protein
MALQLSATCRNQRLNTIETAIGTSAVVKIRTGSAPATVGAADSGTVLTTLQLPADWMAAAASGAKAKTGTWQDTAADSGGMAGHFRVYAVGGTVAHIQGTVTTTAGGGDMTIQNLSVATGQQVTITSFTLTDGNA